MKIYLVRHGQTQENVDHILSGNSNTSLTEEGQNQARNAISQISNTCSIMYSSDLVRCKQTAAILNEKLKLPVVYDMRLRERDMGAFQGKDAREVDPKINEDGKKLTYDNRAVGGESVEDVKKRVISFIDDVQKKEAGKEILVVTSAGIIRLMHFIFNNTIPEIIHNSSIHEFELKD